MEAEYDFSQGKRGAIEPKPSGQTRITIPIDYDILDWFWRSVHLSGGGNYQGLISDRVKFILIRWESSRCTKIKPIIINKNPLIHRKQTMKYWRETLAVAQRILLELGRRKRSLIFWGIFPITILLLNGIIIAERANLSTAEAFTQAAPVSLVGAALFFSCLGGSVATVVSEREQHTLKRLFLSPLSGVSYFFGLFVAHACIGVGQGIFVYLVAAFLGVRIEQYLFLGLLVILMSISAYVGLGFILGTQLARRTEDVNALVAAFGVPLLILGGTFLPASLFPQSLLNLAQFNPIYHQNEALLGLWAQEETFEEILPHFAFLGGFTLLMLGGGWLSYQGMLRRERRL